MALLPTEDVRVSRDTTSSGLVSTNVAELRKHRASVGVVRKQLQQQQLVDVKFREMSTRLDRCEHLLSQLLSQVVALAQSPISLVVGKE